MSMNTVPLIAEIIGPSGAGKSALSASLNLRDRTIRAGLTVWGLPLRSLLGSGIISLPAILGICVARKRVRVDEMQQIVRLNALYRKLKTLSAESGLSKRSALFLDEGVVFALAKVHADGLIGNAASSRSLDGWEKVELDKWSKVLNVLIWLDAPDDLLIDRIRTRAKSHRMKERPDDEVREFLARYRASYERIIYELISRRSDIRVIKFSTEEAQLDSIASKIISHIGDKAAGFDRNPVKVS